MCYFSWLAITFRLTHVSRRCKMTTMSDFLRKDLILSLHTEKILVRWRRDCNNFFFFSRLKIYILFFLSVDPSLCVELFYSKKFLCFIYSTHTLRCFGEHWSASCWWLAVLVLFARLYITCERCELFFRVANEKVSKQQLARERTEVASFSFEFFSAVFSQTEHKLHFFSLSFIYTIIPYSLSQ